MTAYPDPGPRPCGKCGKDYTPLGRLDRGVCSACWSAIHGTREYLTDDEKMYVACILAAWTDPVLTDVDDSGIGGSGYGVKKSYYDAVGWASWDSVEGALKA